MRNYRMYSLKIAPEELGLIEVLLDVIENSIDRNDLDLIASIPQYELIYEYYSQGYFDDLKKIIKEIETKK